jgi:hypothetical protein
MAVKANTTQATDVKYQALFCGKSVLKFSGIQQTEYHFPKQLPVTSACVVQSLRLHIVSLQNLQTFFNVFGRVIAGVCEVLVESKRIDSDVLRERLGIPAVAQLMKMQSFGEHQIQG